MLYVLGTVLKRKFWKYSLKIKRGVQGHSQICQNGGGGWQEELGAWLGRTQNDSSSQTSQTLVQSSPWCNVSFHLGAQGGLDFWLKEAQGAPLWLYLLGILKTSGPIQGMFVLIWMHFSCWIQIQILKILKRVKFGPECLHSHQHGTG